MRQPGLGMKGRGLGIGGGEGVGRVPEEWVWSGGRGGGGSICIRSIASVPCTAPGERERRKGPDEEPSLGGRERFGTVKGNDSLTVFWSIIGDEGKKPATYSKVRGWKQTGPAAQGSQREK